MKYGKAEIVLCQDAEDVGRRAASDVAHALRKVLSTRDEARIILAAGESQITFLDALAQQLDTAWNRIVCFNMDEFWDPQMDRRFTCEYQIRTQLYDKVNPKTVHRIDCNTPDPEAEAQRFENVFKSAGPIDVLCNGIGTSGHIAFNEPGITTFDEPRSVKVIDIHDQSKKQLRDDPNFKQLGYVPDKGITMTVPALMSAKQIFTIVPLPLKRDIMTRVLATPKPDENLPASILSTATGNIYVDHDSAPLALQN